uniref:Uncharacterized protein n=1 Tax=Steinernema glaseri TaxID=37863 RepID=A0A1I7YAQ9_9BILA
MRPETQEDSIRSPSAASSALCDSGSNEAKCSFVARDKCTLLEDRGKEPERRSSEGSPAVRNQASESIFTAIHHRVCCKRAPLAALLHLVDLEQAEEKPIFWFKETRDQGDIN